MTQRETTDLEDPQSWDLDNPVKAEPVKNRRTVVSVSLPSNIYQVVSAAAEQAGLSTSQFIREAALAKASPAYAESVISWSGGTDPVVAHLYPACTTLAQTSVELPVEYTIEDKGARVYAHALS